MSMSSSTRCGSERQQLKMHMIRNIIVIAAATSTSSMTAGAALG